MGNKISEIEHNDMSMTPILSKYQYHKPKDFGDYMERCYPVSAVMDMLKEYSDQQNKQLLDKISELENSLEINEKLRNEDTNDFVKALNEYSDKNKELIARVDELENKIKLFGLSKFNNCFSNCDSKNECQTFGCKNK